MKDATRHLRTATRRAKSDVANKLVSMFLHELSRRASREWSVRVDDEEYERRVREEFRNRCPYCSRELLEDRAVIEHLDGMNRYRVGLHVPGNVLVACRKCNLEKRRDDSLKILSLAPSGWESFLSHDGSRCSAACLTCTYWKTLWPDDGERKRRLAENAERIRRFRAGFSELATLHASVAAALPSMLAKLYSDCQAFAQSEIESLVQRFESELTRVTTGS